ncbi:hypothetical protein CIPAW_12G127900 [Carya illinoinensis]|uniref:Uncharacterized protein n=1 Tax=Carya illinoinensis TaxID=32201 RepID=A0A8T1P0V4_CARIL|nr:hypothetical protein CIPAW_12G127900 [Carya illinoinensis]
MDPHNYVDIGARGTGGSLVMKEIEHLSRLGLSCQGSSHETDQTQIKDMASTGSHDHFRHTFGSDIATQEKKKKRSRILSRISSMVEVSDNNRPFGIPVSVTGMLKQV